MRHERAARAWSLLRVAAWRSAGCGRSSGGGTTAAAPADLPARRASARRPARRAAGRSRPPRRRRLPTPTRATPRRWPTGQGAVLVDELRLLPRRRRLRADRPGAQPTRLALRRRAGAALQLDPRRPAARHAGLGRGACRPTRSGSWSPTSRASAARSRRLRVRWSTAVPPRRPPAREVERPGRRKTPPTRRWSAATPPTTRRPSTGCVSMAARAALPWATCRPAGPHADPATALTWGLLIISVVVVVIIDGARRGRRRRPARAARRRRGAPRGSERGTAGSTSACRSTVRHARGLGGLDLSRCWPRSTRPPASRR